MYAFLELVFCCEFLLHGKQTIVFLHDVEFRAPSSDVTETFLSYGKRLKRLKPTSNFYMVRFPKTSMMSSERRRMATIFRFWFTNFYGIPKDIVVHSFVVLNCEIHIHVRGTIHD